MSDSDAMIGLLGDPDAKSLGLVFCSPNLGFILESVRIWPGATTHGRERRDRLLKLAQNFGLRADTIDQFEEVLSQQGFDVTDQLEGITTWTRRRETQRYPDPNPRLVDRTGWNRD